MKVKLKQIATIQTGAFAKPVQSGEIVYLQAKHFDEAGNLPQSLYPDLDADTKIEKHLLQSNDILFAAKGARNFAACFKFNGFPAVASTSFFVIRLKDQRLLPEYLTWFLNTPITLNYLKSQAKGSSIVSISKAVLAEVDIPLPSITKQRLVLKIDQLRFKEKELKQKIETLRETEIQSILINNI